MRRSLFLIPVLLIPLANAGAQPVRRDYYPGDWVSFVMQRRITGLAQSFDMLYIGTTDGVGRFNTVRQQFLTPLTASSGLDDPSILRIAFDDGTGDLWVETPLGSASYNPTFDEWRQGGRFPAELVTDDVGSVRFDNLFSPWELSYMPPDRTSPHGMFMDHNLRQYPITTALVDESNRDRVYIGAWGYGLGEVDRISWRATFHPYGLYQEAVEAMHRAGDKWYFAGRDPRGNPPVVSVWDAADSNWTYLQPYYAVAAGGDVTALESMPEWLFCGTPEGLLRYSFKNEKWRRYDHRDGLPDDEITALAVDGELIWVGTERGPGLLDPKADTGAAAISLATPTIGSNWVYCFARAYGYIWAGTAIGLYRINQREGDWSRITTPDGLLLGHVRGLVVRPEGIWCATDGGIVLLDSLLEAKQVFRADVDIPGGDLYALAVDGSNVWASSRGGVWRYMRSKSIWRHYGNEDGLLDNFVYAIELDGDYVWFATDHGVSRFYWNNSLRID